MLPCFNPRVIIGLYSSQNKRSIFLIFPMIKSYIYNIISSRNPKQGIIAVSVRFFLLVLSYVYGLFIRILSKSALRSRESFGCKVISVGNITWGGTGKTVAVEHIACFLRSKGRRVAVISRGYKRAIRPLVHQATGEQLGDEPQMLKDKLLDIPVLSGPDRKALIKRAIREFGSDTVVLDDGFQQWGINKDLDIVAIDVNNPFGNLHMIPRGILREPLSALKRAGLFLITKCSNAAAAAQLKNDFKNISLMIPVVLSRHKACGLVRVSGNNAPVNPEELKNKKVVLASGIADPGSFKDLVSSQSILILGHIEFDDHHNYTAADAGRILSVAGSVGADAVIVTEKDAVKLKGIFPAQTAVPVYFLRVALEITHNEEEFHRRLLGACNN